MSGDSRRSSSMEITLNDLRDNMEHATDPTEECGLPGVSGEPKMCPRVGDEFQAVIPDLIQLDECSKPNAGKVNEAINDLLPVLPIPLMWAPNKARDAESLRARHSHSDPYVEDNPVVLNSENGSTLTEMAEEATDNKVEILDIRLKVDKMKLDIASQEGNEKMSRKLEKILYPLPGTPDEPWSDFEQESFLLALYIFGKDLYLVKKFVETKKMEDVISFYYGPFYKCVKYQRWAKCLRSRSRKSIHGQRMFTKGRHEELVSRLNRHISEETSSKLAEASKIFKEEGMSFEDYVFTLQDLVGTKLFIEVVAIGKGKQDLTGIATEPLKINRSFSARRETQHDKGLSSLSCIEITEQLTSSRLSKTKSNELFWEAVWPRLLAGGWHSEQTKDHGVLTLKHHLVFLMPGVKKFRRNKHVKGKHYFDSVSDVLNKVASDPRILELENEREKDSMHEENHSDEQDSGLPNGKPNGYLKLCNSNQRKDEMEFMIVDTSKRRGSKVQWMQTLPVLPGDISSSSSACSGTGGDSSSEKSDCERVETNLTKFSKYGFDRTANGTVSIKKQEFGSSGLKKKSSNKHRLGGKLNSGPSKYLSPLKKQQVNATGLGDTSEVAEKKKEKHFVLGLPNPCKLNENKGYHNGLDKQLSTPNSVHLGNEGSNFYLPSSSPKVSEANEFMVREDPKEIEKSLERTIPRVVIDLNIPQIAEDYETNHVMIHNPSFSSSMAENAYLTHKHKHTDADGARVSSARETPQQRHQVASANIKQHQPQETHLEPRHLKTQQAQKEQRQPKHQQEQQKPSTQQEQEQEQEQEPNMSGRRHSTRNRPLTTKALEALESNFFESKKKRKATDSSTSRPSRRQRGNSKSNSTSDSGIGSNDMTSGTRIEEESPSGNSGNAPVWLMPHKS